MSDGHQFGSLEIRPREWLILIDGTIAPLRGRAFDLLVALIERRDRVVPRSELYEAVWGQRVVEDGNLDVQVHAIRKLLGKQALVTVPGRGYRFALGSSDQAAVMVTTEASESIGQIPPLPARLVGRDDDLVALDTLLAEHRLVTLLGAGGIGKTTVAVATAHRRRPMCNDGVFWVEASPVRNAILLLQAAARAFNLIYAGSMVSVPAFANALESTRALLVIDNAEHLVEEVAELTSELMLRASGIQILVTSQTALRLPDERVFRLAPLSVPSRKASFAEAEVHGAVQLFFESARAADHRFKLDEQNIACVVSICRQLDGLPFAIKLAAARVPFLGLRGLESRLSNRFALIGGGHRNAPTRQQTLRAAMDWSYSLLSTDEKIVLDRLSVFVGTFDLDFAVAVVRDDHLDEERAVDGLACLVERSFVVASDAEPIRYRLLESTRDYAGQRLAASRDVSVVQRRHARAAADTINRLYEQSWTIDEQTLLPAFVDEIDNVRAALEWAIDGDPATAVEIMGASIHLLAAIGLFRELIRFGARIDPLVDEAAGGPDAARYLLWRSLYMGGFNLLARYPYASKAAAIYRSIGDREGLCVAMALMLGSGHVPPREADELLGEIESMPWRDWSSKRQWIIETSLAVHLNWNEMHSRAAERFERAATMAGRSGILSAYAVNMTQAALARYLTGNIDEPLVRCQKVLDHERQRRHGNQLFPLGIVGVGQVLMGRIADARASFATLYDLLRQQSSLFYANLFSQAFVVLAMKEGRNQAAACLLGYADRNLATLGLGILRNVTMDEARAALDERIGREKLERLMAAGRSLSPEQVCDLTLATSDADDCVEVAIEHSIRLQEP